MIANAARVTPGQSLMCNLRRSTGRGLGTQKFFLLAL